MAKAEFWRTRAVRSALSFVGLGCVLALAGCGGGGGGVAISGRVTLDGQPLETGTITLIPEGEGMAATATITGGSYSIARSEGPTPGKYRVEIHSMRSTGRVPAKVVDPDYAGEETVDVIPPRYHRDSELQVEIKPRGDYQADFPLESAKAGGATPKTGGATPKAGGATPKTGGATPKASP